MKFRITVLSLACITLTDLKNAQCNVACHWAGFDSGFYSNQQCNCIEIKDFEVLTGTKRLRLPLKKHKSRLSSDSGESESVHEILHRALDGDQ